MYYYGKKWKGDVFIILTHTFFISFIINLFVVLYAIYSFFDIVLFHNLQGYRLKIKKDSLNL